MTARFTVDDLARPMPLDRGARHIVSLAPACTECLIALGALDRLVGVEEHSDLPELRKVSGVGGFKYVDLDAVVALTPDLVVAAWPGSTTPADLGMRDGRDRLAAVKSGHFYEIPAGLVKRPGRGLIDGLERLATLFTAFD